MSFEEREKLKLEDVIDVKHGFAFKGEFFSSEPTNNVLLTPGNFKIGGGFKDDKFKYYSGEVPVDYLLNEGDVIVTMTDLSKEGDTIGYSAKIPAHSGIKYLHNQRLGLLKFKNGRVEKDYIYWLLRTADYQNFIRNSATGTTVRHTSPSRIKQFEFTVPMKKEVQRRITSILSSLDNKIELNRQNNQTLEAIAQAIFKEWFVDFNFPGATGEMHDSELGEMPKGWKVVELSEVITIKHGFAFKGEFFSDIETQNVLLTPGNFKIGGGFNYSKFKYYSGDVPNEYVLSRGDVIVTMTDLSKEGDTLGYSALVPEIQGKRLLHNQRIGKIQFKNNDIEPFIYFLLRQDNYRNFVLGGATGSTVRHTSPSRICEYKFALPPAKALQAFKKLVEPLVDMTESNFAQTKILTQLRDSLLPKLMRGEIKVASQ